MKNIPSSPEYWVFLSRLVQYANACSTYEQFLKWEKLLTKQDYPQSWLKSFYSKLYGRYNEPVSKYSLKAFARSNADKRFFLYLLLGHFNHRFACGFFRFPDNEKEHKADVTDQQTNPTWHLILQFLRSVFSQLLFWIFLLDFWFRSSFRYHISFLKVKLWFF